MRVLRRSRLGDSPERGPRAGERRSPPTAVTRWLRQGLSVGMCPLCRVAHKADREYIWHFFDEGANEGAAIDRLRAACGFCSEHIEMLRRIEIEGLKSTLAISTLFADTFEGIVEDLNALEPDAPFVRAPCPACANRDDYVRKNVGYLLDQMATGTGYEEEFQRSPGLCFAHFELAWALAASRADRQLLLTVQRSSAGSLLDDLREHVRKHDDKYRHEQKGRERDSWQRAIFLSAGWPPPTESAAEPEQRAREDEVRYPRPPS